MCQDKDKLLGLSGSAQTRKINWRKFLTCIVSNALASLVYEKYITHELDGQSLADA